MTPKEKARELVNKFYQTKPNEAWFYSAWDQAKQCALIAVDEIIKSREEDSAFDDTLSSTGSEYYTPHPMYLIYHLDVKKEIEKL